MVFGEAGTQDFAFPSPNQRRNPTWEYLVSTAGTRSHGSGKVLVVSDGNIASDYDTGSFVGGGYQVSRLVVAEVDEVKHFQPGCWIAELVNVHILA